MFKKVIILILCLPVSVHAFNLEKRVVKFRLPNGMTWLLMARPEAPVFSGVLQVKAGGIEESKGKTGLAHMLEHMAFKGTEEISGPELWDAFITNGANELNAYTSKDITSYYASMPASKLELWAYLTSEMLGHSVMDDFLRERGVVMEERRNSVENNPQGKMLDALLDTAFDKSPYKWSTIGTAEDIGGLLADDLIEFKKKYYIPQRMVGAIVGDIDVEKTKAVIARYFGAIPAGSAPRETFSEDVQTAEKRTVVKFDASPSVILAYHKPTLPHPDDYVFDVITYILCEGESARLKKELVQDKKLVRSINCDTSVPGARLGNLFVVVAAPIKGHGIREIEDAVELELEKLKNGPVTETEIKKAGNNALKDFTYKLVSNEGLAESLAYFETMTGDWRYISTHANILNKIGAEDVIRTARKYFVKENKTVVELSK